MSNGPVPGNQIPPLLIPLGRTVFFSGMVQAAWNQYVELWDSQNNVIFTMQGSSPDGHTPTSIGSGSFVAKDPTGLYTLGIGINGTINNSSVLWDEDDINYNDTIYLYRYTFIAEDSTDQDWNDSYVSLLWFRTIGEQEGDNPAGKVNQAQA